MQADRYQMLAQRVELFKGFTAEDVAKIFAKGTTMRVKKGDIIFYKGTSGDQMYVILGGKVSLYDGNKKLLADLGVGSMFGEMALISDDPRSATAVAAEDSFLFILSETLFQKLLTKRVAIAMLLNIIGSLSTRLRSMNERLARLEQQVQPPK